MLSRQVEVRVTLADGRVGYAKADVPEPHAKADSHVFAERYLTPIYAAATMYAEARPAASTAPLTRGARINRKPRGRHRG